ncbi:MAG: general secretion pathway protein H [Pseudohongiellaceae bacterium]|jgi:general secretion pathway protein H
MERTVLKAAKKMTPTLAFKATQPQKTSKSQAGFTLLEILLVLTIIGMASALVVPNITNFESRTFDAQIRQANSLLNYARRIAVVKGQPAVVSFIINSDGSKETRERRISPVGEWHSEGIQLRFRDSSDREVEIDDRIDITFFPEGGSTGGTLLISLADTAEGESIAIQIDPFTGRIDTTSVGN